MTTKKAVFYIITGETDRAKMGIMVARRAAEFKRFEDVKVILQGPSEKLLLDENPEVKENLDFLIKNHNIDSACKFIAEKMNIAEPILKSLSGTCIKPNNLHFQKNRIIDRF